VSEPRTSAEDLHEVVPGVRRWTIHDERIGFRSDAYAVASAGGAVLIDPLPLGHGALASIGPVAAICLTGGQHQRSAWRFRSELRMPVYAPEGDRPTEEAPDARYGPGVALPGGLSAIRTPGPLGAAHALLLDRGAGGGVLFVGDLLLRVGGGPLALPPDRHLADPALARATVRSLLDLPTGAICPAHGEPVVGTVRAAILEALGEAAP
jgi:glyoxylase-like metal-dependent hydrolase (beta-lactamase superfamily II)